MEALCADPAVDAVYIATPHQFHVEHVRLAAAHGKHVLVEKPMALAIADCQAMVDAAAAAGIHLLVGHSHSFDLPYLRTRALIDTGAFGAVRMINALNFTDYLYRPRRPEELDTAQGGGALFSQAPHQVEVVRLLAGSPARSVRASAGIWDAARPTEGAYAAHLSFDDGVFASLTYNGYGHFDTDALHGWIGELGQRRDPRATAMPAAAARRADARGRGGAEEPPRLRRRRLGRRTLRAAPPPPAYNHFGLVIVSCERGDLRPMPNGVEVFANDERRFETLPAPAVPRAEVIDELVAAVLDGNRPLHTGEWGMATTEICLAILQSSTGQHEVALHHQVGLPSPIRTNRHALIKIEAVARPRESSKYFLEIYNPHDAAQPFVTTQPRYQSAAAARTT